MINWFLLFPFISFTVNIILASVVLGLNPGSKTNRAYAVFAFNFAFWALITFAEWNFQSEQSLKLFAYLEPFAWLFTTFLVIRFIYILIKRPFDIPYRVLQCTVAGWVIYAALTGGFIQGFKKEYWGVISLVNDIYYVALIMVSVIPSFWGIYLLIKTIKTTSDTLHRIHLGYLTFGSIIMYVIVMLDSVIRASLLKISFIPSISSFLLLIQSAFVFIAILRHRFLNPDLRDVAHQIFERINECVIQFNLDQSICNVNDATVAFFGKDRLYTSSLTQLFGEHYRFNDDYTNLEITISNSGTSKYGLLSQSSLFIQGRYIGKLVIIRDITLNRQETLQRITLEKQVQEMNVSRLEALGKLAGGIAHDFNNILSVISGSATLLRMHLLNKDEKAANLSMNIIKTSQDASLLTRKMLTFARQHKHAVSDFDLHETIGDIVTMLHHTLEKRISLHTAITAEQHQVTGDRILIQNMLLNIAINACDAMPDGGDLHIKTTNKVLLDDFTAIYNKDASGGLYIIADIEDNGIGMTPELQKKIFEPFFTTKQKGKGTGLGLATAYGTVVGHKGFIIVKSESGKGSAFQIYLPVSNNPPDSAAKNTLEIDYGKGQLLIVDDEANILDSTSEMLREIGYSTTICNSGEDALKQFQENVNAFDLVILDVLMPVMNGLQCAKEMKKLNPDVKTLFISGYLGDISAQDAVVVSTMIQPDNFIQKPFTIEQLSNAVKKLIEKS
jgi:signal transduction histidine kinase/ActR/RegA family two-component response regulator